MPADDVRRPLNPLKALLDSDGVALGGVLTAPSVQVAQALGRAGFDWVLVDMEHYPMDVRDVHEAIAALAATPATPIVRIRWNVEWLAKPVLDVGALGIVFPMIRSREEAEAAVASVKYPPAGTRGWGPSYATLTWGISGADYARAANEEILTVALIEHVEAVENIAEIAATPGVDVAFIATNDLAASLGHLGDLEHAEVKRAIRRIEKAVLESPAKLGGIGGAADRAREMIQRGYRFLNMGADVDLMKRTAEALLAEVRGGGAGAQGRG